MKELLSDVERCVPTASRYVSQPSLPPAGRLGGRSAQALRFRSAASIDGGRVFAEVYGPRPRLLIYGAEEAFAEVAPDHQTAVLVLTHEDKFDRPALLAALKTEAFYIGALGSRRNQERRRARMLESGADEQEFERISGPCGLDIGAETIDETAVSIIAEILATRAERAGGPIKEARQRIHAQAE